MTLLLRQIAVVSAILVISSVKILTAGDKTDRDAVLVRHPPQLRTLIDARRAEIETDRTTRRKMFAIVDEHLALFERPLLVPTERRQRTVPYLRQPLDVSLLDRDLRRIAERYPLVFQELRTAAKEWLVRAEGILQDRERFAAVESVYAERLVNIRAECSCPRDEWLALVEAAGPHNLQNLPGLDDEYLMAWEATLLRADVSWSVKAQVLPIVFRFRDAESVPTLVEVRHMAIACERKRDEHESNDCFYASRLARLVADFLPSQPTRAALMELAAIVKQEKDERARVAGVVPPDTTRIGLELSGSKEWNELLDTAELENDMVEHVALLREAMRLASGQKTKGRD